MKIGIILHPYGEKTPAGLGRYIFDLTASLIENDKTNEYIIYLKGKPDKLPVFNGSNWRAEIVGGGKFWLETGLRKAPAADVYVFNTPIMPFFFSPKRSVVITLDFAYKYFKAKSLKEYLFNKFLFFANKFSLKRADLIVSISEQTKKDILKFFGLSEQKIKVIYPGFKKICSLPAREVKLPEKFFLHVGVIKERKNLLNIVKGFREFKRNDKNGCKLVVAGKGEGEYYEKIARFIKSEKIESDVVFIGFVDDNELAFIYKKALALVFPSLLEGFGFPVLEAMNCGLPVITSKYGSLAEVAGNAGILVDPQNTGEISATMEKIYSNNLLRHEMSKDGIVRAEEFSWQRSAERFISLFKTLQ